MHGICFLPGKGSWMRLYQSDGSGYNGGKMATEKASCLAAAGQGASRALEGEGT